MSQTVRRHVLRAFTLLTDESLRYNTEAKAARSALRDALAALDVPRIGPDPESPVPPVAFPDSEAIVRQFEADARRAFTLTPKGRDALAGGALDDSRIPNTREVL